eukprot:CAMPEP_0194133326 /NCGR_PEP_ID=MMETSP0152-20130528/3545_1 /TAXON_ID=1049557 /ORGANISM="Thalassiothrix antarctica, Strain L6-D1" /LENGTH=599 /DNA_ID=CAMNT_0038828623 /DNA_START=46 /DNA_END=1845 /DNA_ORIENTATION=+
MSNTSRLQLSLSAKSLTNLAGILNTSDPFAVITVRGDSQDNPPVIVGQTEVVYNSLKPQWSTVIFLDGYKFGVPHYVEVGVFDFQAKQVGENEKNLAKQSSEQGRLITSNEATRDLIRAGKLPHKVMGTALFELGQILGAKGNLASKSLQTGGVLFAHVERSRSDGSHGVMKFQLRGIDITNTRSLGRKSNPFFTLYRKVDSPMGATWSSVFRSNVIKSNLNPKWEAAKLNLEAICNGDMNRAMKVVVRDYRRRGRHLDIGEFETTMQRFVDAKNEGGDVDEDAGFTLHRNDKKTGNVLIIQAGVAPSVRETSDGEHVPLSRQQRVKSRPEFIDYLTGGCQISLAVAIDFTASNGDPREEGTPHYFYPPDSEQWNDYQKAIFAVGSILEKYDSDGLVPTWGFGAKYGPKVRHCFQCGDEVEAKGVNGIMDAYRGVFSTQLIMSYPTDFTEVIRTAASYVQHKQEVAEEENDLSYTILLILTAGNIENVQETKQQLIEASDTPLSIVIVGIGDNDFASMEFLDEHQPEVEGGRDITQFVRFNDYKSYNLLTEAVLDEIPNQLVEYFYDRDILPGIAEDIDKETVAVMPADDDERTVTFLG